MTAFLQSVNYYSARKALAASTAQSLVFFRGQGSIGTGEWNDLGDDGILPDNAEGDLTAIFIRNSTPESATAATNAVTNRVFIDLINLCQVTTRLSGVEVAVSQPWANAGPPEWFAGAPDSTSAGTGGYRIQNGGYMLQFLKHPVHRRGQVQITLQTKAALGTAATTSHFVTAAIQIITRKEIA